MRLRDISEGELLARVFPVYAGARPPAWGSVPVGPGDDAAVVGAPGGSVVATTDTMVRVRDWRDEWSSAHDVGVKVATQNLADIAAMGAEPTGLLVSLVADPDLDVEWAVDLARGIASVAEQAGAPVVGGDLSSGGPGVVVVAVTALGDLRGRAPVLRSGARVGDVVAVCGSLGLSGVACCSSSGVRRTPTGRRRRTAAAARHPTGWTSATSRCARSCDTTGRRSRRGAPDRWRRMPVPTPSSTSRTGS